MSDLQSVVLLELASVDKQGMSDTVLSYLSSVGIIELDQFLSFSPADLRRVLNNAGVPPVVIDTAVQVLNNRTIAGPSQVAVAPLETPRSGSGSTRGKWWLPRVFSRPKTQQLQLPQASVFSESPAPVETTFPASTTTTARVRFAEPRPDQVVQLDYNQRDTRGRPRLVRTEGWYEPDEVDRIYGIESSQSSVAPSNYSTVSTGPPSFGLPQRPEFGQRTTGNPFATPTPVFSRTGTAAQVPIVPKLNLWGQRTKPGSGLSQSSSGDTGIVSGITGLGSGTGMTTPSSSGYYTGTSGTVSTTGFQPGPQPPSTVPGLRTTESQINEGYYHTYTPAPVSTFAPPPPTTTTSFAQPQFSPRQQPSTFGTVFGRGVGGGGIGGGFQASDVRFFENNSDTLDWIKDAIQFEFNKLENATNSDLTIEQTEDILDQIVEYRFKMEQAEDLMLKDPGVEYFLEQVSKRLVEHEQKLKKRVADTMKPKEEYNTIREEMILGI